MRGLAPVLTEIVTHPLTAVVVGAALVAIIVLARLHHRRQFRRQARIRRAD